VYNFLVDDLHNYVVGQDEILVHNANSPGKHGDIEWKGKTRDNHTDYMKRGHSRDKNRLIMLRKVLLKNNLENLMKFLIVKNLQRARHSVI
jgi:hypothetical protein